MRLPRRRWHRHRYQLSEGFSIPTPFDTWIAESLARDDAGLFEAERQPRDERRLAVRPQILVAEDDRDTREVLAFYLGSMGYEALIVVSGRAAMELARQRRPDLLLADVDLPDVDGLELIRRLRAEEALSGLPILAVTPHGSEETEKAMAAGADACLAKPLDFANLAQTIEGMLG
jgi:CheY-like chemotaxis protein